MAHVLLLTRWVPNTWVPQTKVIRVQADGDLKATVPIGIRLQIRTYATGGGPLGAYVFPLEGTGSLL